MKFSSAIAAAGVASLAGAQVLLPNGSFSCPIPNGAYCLAENIILRCIGSSGYAGNCNDNLAGEPPVGVNPTLCVTPCGNETGRAACSKNGIVYPGSGVGLGNVTFPVGDTSVCNSTTTSSSATSSATPYSNRTSTSSGVASSTGGSGGGKPTGSSVPYTGDAASSGMLGAGAVVGFGAIFAAINML